MRANLRAKKLTPRAEPSAAKYKAVADTQRHTFSDGSLTPGKCGRSSLPLPGRPWRCLDDMETLPQCGVRRLWPSGIDGHGSSFGDQAESIIASSIIVHRRAEPVSAMCFCCFPVGLQLLSGCRSGCSSSGRQLLCGYRSSHPGAVIAPWGPFQPTRICRTSGRTRDNWTVDLLHFACVPRRHAVRST